MFFFLVLAGIVQIIIGTAYEPAREESQWVEGIAICITVVIVVLVAGIYYVVIYPCILFSCSKVFEFSVVVLFPSTLFFKFFFKFRSFDRSVMNSRRVHTIFFPSL